MAGHLKPSMLEREHNNSHELAKVGVSCFDAGDGIRRFKLFVDGEPIKTLSVDVGGRGRDAVEVSNIQPIEQPDLDHRGFETPTTLTVGRLMQSLAAFVLDGRGNERVIIDLPNEVYADKDVAARPRVIIREGPDKLVLQVQRMSA